ncbi:cupredoxin domain-containing protein [Arthrobacter cheniae]|uniref:cupredoxin domain-containing protein n=1 Tax=Arthrobacter cheniae TaxID=1258888 RepID=UPI001C7D7D4E|nr:cupredoxin domain-containing protein [Arthrobacter cheniae]
MITREKLLSSAMASALISGVGLVAAGPAMAAPMTAVTASSVSVPTMTMGSMTITITGFQYSGTGTISPGTQISVTNTDSEVHTVTANNGAFDVTVPGGETVTFAAPTEGGTYSFFCKFHGNMKGSLTVTAGAAAPTPAAPAAPMTPVTPAPAPAPASPGTSGMKGMDQMGAVPRGGADTGAEQATNDSNALLLSGGLVLVALAGGTYVVRRRTTSW